MSVVGLQLIGLGNTSTHQVDMQDGSHTEAVPSDTHTDMAAESLTVLIWVEGNKDLAQRSKASSRAVQMGLLVHDGWDSLGAETEGRTWLLEGILEWLVVIHGSIVMYSYVTLRHTQKA